MALVIGQNMAHWYQTPGAGQVDWILDLIECSISISRDSEEGAGANEQFSTEVPTKYGWTLTAAFHVAAEAPFMALAVDADPQDTFKWLHTATKYWSGAGNVKTASHKIGNGLQRVDVTISGKGALTYA